MKTIIINIFIREKSALTEYNFKLANEFLDLGYRVIIISSEQRNDLVTKDENQQFLIKTWPSYQPTKLQDLLFLSKIIWKYKPTMIISNFNATNFSLIAGWFFKIPHRVVWVHTLPTQAGENHIASWKLLRKKYLFKLATYFIANSEATKKDSINRYLISENKIATILNLIEDNNEKISLEKEDNTLVFVGRYNDTKGIDTLIKAMKIATKTLKKLKLKIIAGGDDTKYQKMVKDLNLSDNIIFLGRQPREEVFNHLSTAQCSIVPSKSEAFGYVVIEAFSVKTPVIGSDTGGISEIITDNSDGLLFPVDNEKILAEKIIFMLTNKKFCKQSGENAYQTFQNKYELNKNIKYATKKFQEILEMVK